MTSWAINLVLANSKKFKPFQASFLLHCGKIRCQLQEKTTKSTNIWKLNNTLLNNQQVTKEIKKLIKICIERNENENTTTPNLWESVKAVLRGRFIAIQAYLKKQEKNK